MLGLWACIPSPFSRPSSPPACLFLGGSISCLRCQGCSLLSCDEALGRQCEAGQCLFSACHIQSGECPSTDPAAASSSSWRHSSSQPLPVLICGQEGFLTSPCYHQDWMTSVISFLTLACAVLSDFAAPRTVAQVASSSMGFSRQKYWSGLLFPLPGVLSPLRDQTHVSCGKCTGRQILLPLEPHGKSWRRIQSWAPNSDSLQTHGLQPARLLCSWNSPGQNTGVGGHSLLQGLFPTQGLNPCLPHCR